MTAAAARAQTNRGDEVWLAWDPNSEPDIGGYIVYYGVASRVYTNAIDVGNVTTCRVDGLVLGGVKYYFAVTAYNTNGLESDFSDEVSYVTLSNLFTPTLRLVGITLTNVTLSGRVPDTNFVGFIRLRPASDTNWARQVAWNRQDVRLDLPQTNVWVAQLVVTNAAQAFYSDPLRFSNIPPSRPRQLRFRLLLLSSARLDSGWEPVAELVTYAAAAEPQRFYKAVLSVEDR